MNPTNTLPDEDKIQNDHSIEKVVREICSDQESHRGKSCDCEPPPNQLMTRAGPFVLGSEYHELQENTDIKHFIARKFEDTDVNKYYVLKIITLPIDWRQETIVQTDSKKLIYNEYSVLSLLKDVPGVIKERGLYLDYIYESNNREENDEVMECLKCPNLLNGCCRFPYQTVVTMEDIVHPKRKDSNDLGLDHHFLDCEYLLKYGQFFRRLILALDCHKPHCYLPHRPIVSRLLGSKTCPRFEFEFENLQGYVKRRLKRLPEIKALKIFSGIVDIMYAVHAKNVVHRDLCLENILYNDHEEKIIITNFGLSRYVKNDKTCIYDHKGSTAYISPDVLKRRTYQPIASDCWSLGILFYRMLCGEFPFSADSWSDLLSKIQNEDFFAPIFRRLVCGQEFSKVEKLSPESLAILKSLIEKDAGKRNKIAELRERLDKAIRAKINDEMEQPCSNGRYSSLYPVVPDIDDPSIYQSNPRGEKSNNESRSKQSSLFYLSDCDSETDPECDYKFVSDHKIPQDPQEDAISMDDRDSEFSVNHAINNDHIYAQKVPERVGYDAYKNYYYRFLRPSHWDMKLKFSTYIPSLRRFYTDCDSIFDYPGQTSLSFERLLKENPPPNPPTVPTTQQRKKRKSKLTVLKVDSDIRPLEDHEYGMIKRRLRSSTRKNSNI